MRTLMLLAGLCVMSFATADDKKTEPKGEEVSGRITYKGKPLPSGTIAFVTRDEKTSIAAAIAEDGSYKAIVPKGEYKVTISSLVPKKKDDKDPPKKVPEVKIPPKYGDPKTTPLQFEIKEGKNSFDIDLGD